MAPTVLAFDTSGPQISAALSGPRPVSVSEDLKRGQAERLMPLLEDMLREGGLTWQDLDAVAVGVGPGNFTGTRIAVSAARGLAMSLQVPAIGVTAFEWLGHGYDRAGPVLLSLPAPRDQAYVQRVDGSEPQPPQLLKVGDVDPDLVAQGLVVAGYRASEIAPGLGAEADDSLWETRRPTAMAPDLASIALAKLAAAGGPWPDRPAPLYVRPADAVPASDPPPTILP